MQDDVKEYSKRLGGNAGSFQTWLGDGRANLQKSFETSSKRLG
jgi:hypothetical protein